MSSFNNYHNRQNSDYTSPFSGYSGSMQRNPRYNDNQDSLSNQKNLENLLEMLKKKDASSDNPFYDNTYQHNLNVLPIRPQDPSADPQYPSVTRDLDQKPPSVEYERTESLQRSPMQPERRAIDRNEAPAVRNYDKRTLQDNNSGNFFSGVGENNRHKNLVKDYQEYMRNNPIPHPKERKAMQIENERNKVSLRKRNDQDHGNKDWSTKNTSVGILPGMGSAPDNQRQYASPEFRNIPDGYGYDNSGVNRRSPEVDYRRGMSDMNGPSRMNQNPSGSRLAGIGSRLIDGERSYNEQITTPQYTSNREALRFQFQTPQDARKSVELNSQGRFRDVQGYSNEIGRYDSSQPEALVDNFNNAENFRGMEREQNMVLEERRQYPGRQGQDRRDERNSGNNGNNLGWLEERQRQEQDKRNKQREDLQRIYREQIEEKKRKKEEEQRIKLMEDQKEEERLRKENEDLQKQFLSEQQKKKDFEEPKRGSKGKGEEITDKDYLAARKRQNKHNRAFETSEENMMRRDVPELEYMEENRRGYGQEQRNIDDMIQETAKRSEEQLNSRPRYEFSKDPEVEVHREFTRKINATLDEEIEKMRRDVDYHSKLIRNELSSYKTQAMVSQELRENAHKELQRLKQELKNQQIMEERHPYDGFDSQAEDNHTGKNKEREQDRPEHKNNFQLPHKSYAKAFSPDEDGPDLGTSPNMDLDFDTNYVPARETGVTEPKMYREPPKLNELMNKYGVDESTGQIQHRNDTAMKKFGTLFPDHGSKPQVQDSLAALEARLENKAYIKGQQLNSQVPIQAKYSYGKGSASSKDNQRDWGEVEGEDEIQKIEALLKRYRDPDLQEKENVRREAMQSYHTYEKKLMKEFEEEGFGGKGSYGYSENYGKDEEDTDLNEIEPPTKSEVELANITHEVSITQ